MIKVVIADDEKKARIVIKSLIEWDKLGLELCAECVDGDELCEVVSEIEPHIIITDMKMPGLSGNELVKKLNILSKDSKIIIISGYDEFEYTKQAIISKAVDYILKPVDKKELEIALENAITELNQTTKNIISLNRTVHGDIERVENGPRLLNEEGKSIYTVVIFDYYCNNFESIDIKGIGENLLNFISHNIIGGIAFQDLKRDNGITCIFEIFSGEEIQNIIKSLYRDIVKEFNLIIFCGIGKSYLEINQIKCSYLEAALCLKNVNLRQDKKICIYSEEVHRDLSQDREGVINNEFLLDNHGDKDNMVQLKKIIQHIYTSMESLDFLTLGQFKKVESKILDNIENIIYSKNMSSSILYEFQLLKNRMKLVGNDKVSKKLIEDFFEEVFLDEDIFIDLKNESLAGQVKAYIDENYLEKIVLEDLAKNFYISKEYMSKQFKSEFGMGIFDYIDYLKIHRAKQMLMSGKYKINEISSALNFYDQSHFNKRFKKYTGISPKKYIGGF